MVINERNKGALKRLSMVLNSNNISIDGKEGNKK